MAPTHAQRLAWERAFPESGIDPFDYPWTTRAGVAVIDEPKAERILSGRPNAIAGLRAMVASSNAAARALAAYLTRRTRDAHPGEMSIEEIVAALNAQWLYPADVQHDRTQPPPASVPNSGAITRHAPPALSAPTMPGATA